MLNGTNRLITWIFFLLFSSLGSVCAQEGYSFRKTTSVVLLRAGTSKWSSVELVRVSIGDKVDSYRWVQHEDRRDRRGPGKYTQTTRSLLYANVWANADSVRVVTETADELELHLTISGYGKETKMRILAKRMRPHTRNARVTISGHGEIYQEFIALLEAIEAEADDRLDDGEIDDKTPNCPGRLLRWTYLAIPQGRVLE